MDVNQNSLSSGAIDPRANRFFYRSMGTVGLFVASFVLLALALMNIGIEWNNVLGGLSKLGSITASMFPPTLDGNITTYFHAMGQTVAMAFIGTLTAAVLALPFAILAARNMMPVWLVHFASFRFFDTVRSIDMLIWALVFMSAVGPGPFAGVLAITVVEFGILSKLFAEAIETVDQKPLEGLKASGASPAQIIFFGVLPQISPVLLSNALYQMESNTRSASILGIVGAGGIGFLLSEQIRLNQWQNVLGMILMILVVVTLIDFGSSWIQRQFREKKKG